MQQIAGSSRLLYEATNDLKRYEILPSMVLSQSLTVWRRNGKSAVQRSTVWHVRRARTQPIASGARSLPDRLHLATYRSTGLLQSETMNTKTMMIRVSQVQRRWHKVRLVFPAACPAAWKTPSPSSHGRCRRRQEESNRWGKDRSPARLRAMHPPQASPASSISPPAMRTSRPRRNGWKLGYHTSLSTTSYSSLTPSETICSNNGGQRGNNSNGLPPTAPRQGRQRLFSILLHTPHPGLRRGTARPHRRLSPRVGTHTIACLALESANCPTDPSAIKVQSFSWSPLALGWYLSMLWGFIYAQDASANRGSNGLWTGTAIRLFNIQSRHEGISLRRPKGAVDAVGDSLARRITGLGFSAGTSSPTSSTSREV